MPLRSFPSPFAIRLQRLFHASARRTDSTQHLNHYETLQISPHASASEVKKSFYTLSKTHHPDRNPNDPDASSRFVKISEAYAILSSPTKRSDYDREVLPSQNHETSSQTPRGSYYSSGPAGGRTASGLSRRRTQFRGPPASFYRSGGWGEHSTKRKAAQDNGAPGAEAPPDDLGGAAGGMGPGQSPLGAMNDVPHFDRESHFRTQEQNSKRWRMRRKMGEEGWAPSGEVSGGTFATLLVLAGVIGLGIFVPVYLSENTTKKKRRKE